MSIECDCGGTPYSGHDENCPRSKANRTRATEAQPDLLPCPFCGVHLPHMWSLTLDGKEHRIKCTECPGRAEFKSSTREQAIAAWNRRAAPVPAITGRDVDTATFRKKTYAYAEALFKGTAPQTQEAWRHLVAHVQALATREPAPVARDPVVKESLTTAPALDVEAERREFEAKFPLAAWDAELRGYTDPMYTYALVGWRACARSAAQGSAPPDEDWQLVPKDPTTDQWRAGIDAWNDAHGTPAGEDELPNVIYRAMLRAAHSPDSTTGDTTA